MDQVKQHFDLTIANLTQAMKQEIKQEMKEIKSSIDQSKRVTMTPSPSHLSVSPSSHTRTLTRGSEISRRAPSPSPPSSSALNSRREAELQAHLEGVQSLRRDLAVVRQIHVDFVAENKTLFAKLRAQNSTLREAVKTKMGGSRALLDNSKAKLESQSADAIQAVEEMFDVLDAAREDAAKRWVTPSKTQMVTMQSDLQKATEMVERFSSEVATVDPTWRATWAMELNQVIHEQELLKHQSKLCADLKEDIKDATEMFQNVQDFANQRQAGLGRAGSKGFQPPTPDGTDARPNLLMEIRTKEADPTQRLRAIEAQQKAREREKANQTDEFSSELSGFVQGRKLKKTGGMDEVERSRQRKQDQTLKKILTGDGGGEGGGVLSPQITGTVLSPTMTGNGRAREGSTKIAGGGKE